LNAAGSYRGILGIDLAEIQCSATPRLSLKRDEVDARRRKPVMKELRRILVAILIGTTISVGAFAQKNDNRPPKEQPKVVDKEKEKPPRATTTRITIREGNPDDFFSRVPGRIGGPLGLRPVPCMGLIVFRL